MCGVYSNSIAHVVRDKEICDFSPQRFYILHSLEMNCHYPLLDLIVAIYHFKNLEAKDKKTYSIMSTRPSSCIRNSFCVHLNKTMQKKTSLLTTVCKFTWTIRNVVYKTNNKTSDTSLFKILHSATDGIYAKRNETLPSIFVINFFF